MRIWAGSQLKAAVMGTAAGAALAAIVGISLMSVTSALFTPVGTACVGSCYYRGFFGAIFVALLCPAAFGTLFVLHAETPQRLRVALGAVTAGAFIGGPASLVAAAVLVSLLGPSLESQGVFFLLGNVTLPLGCVAGGALSLGYVSAEWDAGDDECQQKADEEPAP